MNWTYRGKEVKSIKDLPKDTVGFVYRIEDENGKFYIGKKSLISKLNTEVSKNVYDNLKKEGFPVTKTKNKAKSKKGSVVWRYKKRVQKETNWQKYNGSNIELNANIKKGLKYSKEIIQVCKNSKQMSYYETKHQICNGVIEENNNSWNENILGKYFHKDLK